MREIKYRAWDKNKEIMYRVNIIDFSWQKIFLSNGFGLQNENLGNGKMVIDGKNFHLMQYTGLKDKNGEEIYEGDIVQYNPHTGYESDISNEEVKWNEDYPGFILDSMCMGLGEFSTEDLKIIGNIYINKDLIE